MPGKQAKVLSPDQLTRFLDHVETLRHPARNRVIVLLSFKAGLRACEIANLRWSMITDVDGNIADAIQLTDDASKTVKNASMGRASGGGRTIPLHPLLGAALERIRDDPPRRLAHVAGWPRPTDPVAPSERGGPFSPNAIALWFVLRYRELNFVGASSHSGRRTFITGAARMILRAGGSLRDVQMLAGHRSLQVTQTYIEADAPAQRRLVNLL